MIKVCLVIITTIIVLSFGCIISDLVEVGYFNWLFHEIVYMMDTTKVCLVTITMIFVLIFGCLGIDIAFPHYYENQWDSLYDGYLVLLIQRYRLESPSSKRPNVSIKRKQSLPPIGIKYPSYKLS